MSNRIPRGLIAIEAQGGVHFKEVEMGAHLNRAIAGIGHRQGDRLPSGVEFKVTVSGQQFSRGHGG
jgi:hypothetical protein